MPTTIIIDMRCLQDPYHSERGIATHARSAILLSREVSTTARDARIIGIIDPALAPLNQNILAIADEIRPNAYVPDLAGPAILFNPSPMSPDHGYIGRLLMEPRLRKAVCVYDFIPLDEPARYLTNAIARLDYDSSMVWMNRYDLFLPISADTARRIAGLFRLGNRQSVVTGVPIAPWLEDSAGQPETPRHILCVAGDDPRKNPELLVRAHAGSAMMQAARIPLIVTGRNDAARQETLFACAVAAGGNPDLLEMPGRVPQEQLLSQYRGAFCVATPSRAEGFSMPVIEAMAAGVPSIASDIPVHAALVADAGLRFDPDDDATLACLLERLVTDEAFRAETIAAQQPVWQKFRARDVAHCIWSAMGTLIPTNATPYIAPTRRKPRIALLTPLPPAKSGIADYSARLAASLEDLADVTLFATAPAPGSRAVSSLAHLSADFDRVVSVMGNGPDHFMIQDLLQRHGGACICHDARLFGLALARHGHDGTARIASAELGRKVAAAEISAWANDESLRAADFLLPIAKAARPLIFHTRDSVTRLYERAGITARYLPFAVPPAWPSEAISGAARAAARARLGIPQEQTAIASFGFVHATKAVVPALRTIAALAALGHHWHLYWVGQAHQDITSFQDLAEELGIAGHVHFLNRYFGEASYRDYLLAADFGLQLRFGGNGNISAALADCIAAGLPTVASAGLAENLKAPAFIKSVPDAADANEMAAGFLDLQEQSAENIHWREERFAYCEDRSMRNYAKALLDILDL